MAGVYQVADSNTTGCISQLPQPGAVWPESISIETLPATIDTTTPPEVNERLKAGSIGGLVVGCTVGIGLFGGLLWMVLTWRRRRKGNGSTNEGEYSVRSRGSSVAHQEQGGSGEKRGKMLRELKKRIHRSTL
jgi:hypothetical protein